MTRGRGGAGSPRPPPLAPPALTRPPTSTPSERVGLRMSIASPMAMPLPRATAPKPVRYLALALLAARYAVRQGCAAPSRNSITDWSTSRTPWSLAASVNKPLSWRSTGKSLSQRPGAPPTRRRHCPGGGPSSAGSGAGAASAPAPPSWPSPPPPAKSVSWSTGEGSPQPPSRPPPSPAWPGAKLVWKGERGVLRRVKEIARLSSAGGWVNGLKAWRRKREDRGG